MNIYVGKQPNKVAKMIVEQAEAWKKEAAFNDFKMGYYAFCEYIKSVNNLFKMRGFMSVYCKSDKKMESGEVSIIYKVPGKRSTTICLINF